MLLTILPLVATALKKRFDKAREAEQAQQADAGDGDGDRTGMVHEGFGARGGYRVEEFGDGDGDRRRDAHNRDDKYDKNDKYDDVDDGNWWISQLLLTLFVWLVLLVIAVAVAASCNAGFRDYVVVVLDPFVYLMIRLAVPCAGAPPAGLSVRTMFS